MSNEPERTPDNPGPDTGHTWLSALDAAVVLGVHERTVRRAIARGVLPATKRSGIWQVDRDELDRWRQSAGRGRTHRSITAPSLFVLPHVPARPPFVAPQPRTPLIGREREIAAVCALVVNECAALITLTGPGGSGTTRLALAVAASLRDRFADGIWFVRNHWLEGMAWLQRALDASAGQPTLERIRILTGAGCLWLMRGDEPAARAFNEESLALCHELGHLDPPDSPLNGLAICANVRGDFEEGHRFNLASLAMLRAHAGSVPSALPLVSVILCNMAWVLFQQERVREAEPLAHEALAMQRDLGFDWAAADTLFLLAHIAEVKRDHEVATASYRESLRLAVETRDLHITVGNLERAARSLAEMDDYGRVALLLGASVRLHEIVADVQGDGHRAELATLASRAQAHLGDAAFDRLYRHGQAMSLEEIMAVGLQASVSPSSCVPAAAARWTITRRELDVLKLLAQGLTDQEIADALYIGRRTVHTHVSRLLDKLGAANRREAVARARTERLLNDPSRHPALS